MKDWYEESSLSPAMNKWRAVCGRRAGSRSIVLWILIWDISCSSRQTNDWSVNLCRLCTLPLYIIQDGKTNMVFLNEALRRVVLWMLLTFASINISTTIWQLTKLWKFPIKTSHMSPLAIYVRPWNQAWKLVYAWGGQDKSTAPL